MLWVSWLVNVISFILFFQVNNFTLINLAGNLLILKSSEVIHSIHCRNDDAGKHFFQGKRYGPRPFDQCWFCCFESFEAGNNCESQMTSCASIPFYLEYTPNKLAIPCLIHGIFLCFSTIRLPYSTELKEFYISCIVISTMTRILLAHWHLHFFPFVNAEPIFHWFSFILH